MKIRRLPSRLVSPFLQFFTKHYFKKQRSYIYKGIKGKINPGIFFPHITLSTKILLDFLDKENIRDKSILELGCGAGIISCFAASKGAHVTASDINQAALENTRLNADSNNVQVLTVWSDLFDNLFDKTFDYIIINPPYYPKSPKTDAEKAWFCGENFEYFQKLFCQLSSGQFQKSKIILILSEDCQVNKIKGIAKGYNFTLRLFHEEIKFGEKNYLFKIESSTSF